MAVVSSAETPRENTGAPRSSSHHRGDGIGIAPCPVRAIPRPVGTAEAEDAFHAEHRQRERDPGDVDDRVEPGELVERDDLDVASLDPSLGLREPTEDPVGEVQRVRRQVGGVQQGPNARSTSRITPRGARGRTSARSARTPCSSTCSNSSSNGSSGSVARCARSSSTVGPGIHERAQRRIARDPGDAVEVGESYHGRLPRRGPRTTARALIVYFGTRRKPQVSGLVSGCIHRR